MRECFAIALFSPELNIFSCREAADSRTLPPGGWGQSLVGADHQEGICNILKNYFINNQKGNYNICLLRCTGLLLPLVTRLVLTAPPQVTLIEVGTSICIVMIVTIIANAII